MVDDEGSRMRVVMRLSVVLVLVLGLVACGDDDGGEENAAVSTTTPSADAADGAESEDPASSETDEPAPSTSAAGDDGGEASGGGGAVAVVTIGDTTYEFDPAAHVVGRCDPDFFGAFWVIAAATDGSGADLEMLLVEDGDPNHDETSKVKVKATDSEGRDWRADEDGGEGTPAGESRVESFTVDGATVTGTASFVDVEAGDGATAAGEFQVTCPPA